MSEEEVKEQIKEEAPGLTEMESAKNAILTFAMYYYQALRKAGYEVEHAKQTVADYILEVYNRYAALGNMPQIEKSIRNPMLLLDEIIEDVKNLGIQGKPIYNKLLDFKRMIKP